MGTVCRFDENPNLSPRGVGLMRCQHWSVLQLHSTAAASGSLELNPRVDGGWPLFNGAGLCLSQIYKHGCWEIWNALVLILNVQMYISMKPCGILTGIQAWIPRYVPKIMWYTNLYLPLSPVPTHYTAQDLSTFRLAPSLFRDISALRNIVTSAGA